MSENDKYLSCHTICYEETFNFNYSSELLLNDMRGKLFLTKSDIILKYELLDTPEFFWEYPELEANYLELKPRTQILSLKLTTIHELFEILADDLNINTHQNSSGLLSG